MPCSAVPCSAVPCSQYNSPRAAGLTPQKETATSTSHELRPAATIHLLERLSMETARTRSNAWSSLGITPERRGPTLIESLHEGARRVREADALMAFLRGGGHVAGGASDPSLRE